MSELFTILIPALWTAVIIVMKEILTLRISFTHLHCTSCLATFTTITRCTLVQLPTLTHQVILSWTNVPAHISLLSMINAHFERKQHIWLSSLWVLSLPMWHLGKIYEILRTSVGWQGNLNKTVFTILLSIQRILMIGDYS